MSGDRGARRPWLSGSGVVARQDFASRLPAIGARTTRGWLAVASGAGGAPGAGGEGAAGQAHDGQREELERARIEAVAAGRAEGRAETEHALAALAAATGALARAAERRDEQIAELAVELALGLCAELAPVAAAIDRSATINLVRGVIDAASADAGSGREIVLRLNADDLAVLGGRLGPAIRSEVGPELLPGEVWLEAPRVVVDGRWASRLTALRDDLLALVHGADAGVELATEGGPAGTPPRTDAAVAPADAGTGEEPGR